MEQELGHSLFIRRKGYRNAQLTDQGAEFYRIAWNKDFKSWHSENFDETIPPLVILEHAALAAYFMTEKSWTFCPYTTAIRLQKNGASALFGFPTTYILANEIANSVGENDAEAPNAVL